MLNFFWVYAFLHLFSQGICSAILDAKESTEPLNIELILAGTKFFSVRADIYFNYLYLFV